MNMNLDQLEARLQALIETKLMSVLPGFKLEDLVVHELANAVKKNLVVRQDGTRLIPNVFTLVINPKSAERWRVPLLLNAMTSSLSAVAEEAGLSFSIPPTITIIEKNELSESQVEVIASQLVEPVGNTHGVTPPIDQPIEKPEKSTIPKNAFLIIDGVKVFPLTDTVVNIGRRLENQLAIDDPRISRNHAQLRAIKGRYVIFDLNSTGGTFVNASRTSQSVLYPGDVISLAGVPLVYGQDNPPTQDDLTKTGPIYPDADDRPTAFFRDTDELKKLNKD